MTVRELGVLTETLHAVVYFAPEPQERYRALGLRGYWRGYFASRAAALGRPSAPLVTALFAGFAPAMVERAVPQVWDVADPADVVVARREGATASLRRLLGDSDATPAAQSTAEVVAGLPLAGRPMAAAQAAVPRPDDPVAALWHDCTVLREHRGDGHLAALAVEGLRWPEPHLLLGSLGHLDPRQQEHRGWSDEQWHGARTRLEQRGLLGTAEGAALLEQVEQRTDELAAAAYEGVDVERLAALLRPLSQQAVADLPFPNAMGLRR